MRDTRIYCSHGPHQWPVKTNGPLSRLRFVYKDLYDVTGFKTGAGNPQWYNSHGPAAFTSPVLQQLFDSGAECVGRVQTDELAYSLNGCNVHFGTPENPVVPERLPGGSSSGSAVAVAKGDADIGLGTDTGGSVRIPAAYNGLYGIRPTHGRLPASGIVPLAPRFDTPGWLCRDAKTLRKVGEYLFAVTCSETDSVSLKIIPALFERLPQPLQMIWSACFAQLKSNFQVSIANLNPQFIDRLSGTFQTLQGRQIASIHRQWWQQHPHSLADDIDQRLQWAMSLTSEQQQQAEVKRSQWIEQLLPLFEGQSVLVLPTSPDLPPLRDSDPSVLGDFRMRLMGMTAMAGLAGCPQIHLPLMPLDGIPFGFSLLGPRDSDLQLLALAEQMSEVLTHD